ncbi:MAG: helix-turn-helix domain-containing protein [Salibacteraceae bacterium]|nr:helix-turn-helix domain-containing protein [Salibacteraceae bacterium]MDP4934887.1 helix-turn-helix domain-containing protein [Salibacteraceae bacterium]MDP4965147.1 helix-turn-helix domain-containing protein [Salibacteraceae bacterium]
MTGNSYIDWVSMSDVSLMETIGRFVQHHRLQQNRAQGEVAKSAGISRSTLSLMERGEKTNLNSLIQVLRVLDLLHVMDVFRIENEISPIEYAKLQKNKRQRASGKVEDPNPNDDLGW